MKVTWSLLVLTAAAMVGPCAASPAPAPAPLPAAALVLHRHRRQLDFFDNTRKLIEELINNLNKAAEQAKDAVAQFNSGLLEQAKRCREKFLQDLRRLQDRVTQSIESLQEKFVSSGSAVGDCVTSHRGAAAGIYQDASQHMAECADSRIQEGSELVGGLSALCTSAQELAADTLAEMGNCSAQHSGNVLALGACLGGVAVRTEVKGASFLMQSGLAIGRINLFMSTLPASLEVCAGSSLVGAGMGTARLLMEIGTCSAHSVISNFGGGSTATGTAAADTAAAGANSVGAVLPPAPAPVPAGNLTPILSKEAATAAVADQINFI